MRTMRLPFLYKAEIYKPRRRTTDRVVVVDHADFAIPHVTSAEAPVSARWMPRSRVRFDPIAVRDTRGPVIGTPVPRVVTRTWEGRSYVPMRDDGGPGIDANAFEAALATPVPYESHRYDWATSRYPGQRGLLGSGTSGPFKGCFGQTLRDHFGPVGTGRVRHDDREDSMRGAMVAFPSSLLVVDGMVWTAVGVTEPHWVVTDHGMTVKVDVDDGACPSWCQAPFRADRRADAIAWAKGVAAAAKRPASSVVVTRDTLEVDDPALLTFDDGVATGIQLLSWNSRITGIFPSHGAPDDVLAMRDEAVALAKAAHEPDLGWASHALGFFGDLRTVMGEHGLWNGDANKMDPALDRWQAVERGRRPDMNRLMEAARGVEDPAMAGFAP